MAWLGFALTLESARRFLGPRRGGGLFARLLREDGGVEPVQAQARVGRLRLEGGEEVVSAVVVVDVDVALVALDQRQDVQLRGHAPPPCPCAIACSSNRIGAG